MPLLLLNLAFTLDLVFSELGLAQPLQKEKLDCMWFLKPKFPALTLGSSHPLPTAASSLKVNCLASSSKRQEPHLSQGPGGGGWQGEGKRKGRERMVQDQWQEICTCGPKAAGGTVFRGNCET